MLVTVQKEIVTHGKVYLVKVTQDYDEWDNCGHYKWFIENGGHLLDANSTIGGEPDGKINEKNCEDLLIERAKWLKLWS